MIGLSKEEIEERRHGIGGTDAGRIMRGEWNRLWLEKMGRCEPEDLSGILRVQLGLFTESFNRSWFEKITGSAVTNHGELRRHPTIAYMRAHIDGLTATTTRQPAVWDAKHVGNAGDTTVERYTPQMTHNALVCGVDWWILSFLVGNSRWEAIEQEVDPFYAAELLKREAEFWRYVETGEEPSDRGTMEAPKPVRWRSIDLADANQPNWPNWGAAMIAEMGAFARTKAAADAHHLARDRIKTLLPDDVGLVTRGRVAVKRARTGAVTIALEKEKADA